MSELEIGVAVEEVGNGASEETVEGRGVGVADVPASILLYALIL